MPTRSPTMIKGALWIGFVCRAACSFLFVTASPAIASNDLTKVRLQLDGAPAEISSSGRQDQVISNDGNISSCSDVDLRFGMAAAAKADVLFRGRLSALEDLIPLGQ